MTKLLLQSTLHSFYNLDDQLLVCSLPRYMPLYRPLLSCNNTPLFLLPRLFCLQNCWEQFSCIRGYIILVNYVSVAWQWIFPALGNSAFQTTCHSIIITPNRTEGLIRSDKLKRHDTEDVAYEYTCYKSVCIILVHIGKACGSAAG
jgi:hypothetical protein